MKASPIFVKTYELLRWLLAQTVKFPKAQRFLLAKRIEDSALGFHEWLVRASRGGGRDLGEADIELTKLRLYLRLAMDLQLLSVGQYEHSARQVDEIGRLLGGWQRVGVGDRKRVSAGDLFPA